MADTQNQSSMNDDPSIGELLRAYLDGELSAEQQGEVEARLRDDEQARELLDQLRSTSEAVRSLPLQTLGYDLRTQVLDRAQVQPRSTILDYNSDEYEANDHSSGRRIVYAAAAIAAALLLMFYQGGGKPVNEQLAMSGDKARVAAPDAVIRSSKSENTQMAGMGGLGAMFSSRQNSSEVAESEISSIPSPNVELIGDQLLGDAPLEHLHVHLKPKAGAAQQDAFAELLEEAGVARMNAPAAQTSSEGYRAQMILVDAPLPQMRQILLHCQQADSHWEAVAITRQSDAAPALSFFAAEAGALESVGHWLAPQDSGGSAWALYLGRGTEAVVPSAEAYAAANAGDQDTDDATRPARETRFDDLQGNIRVLFVLLPAD